MVTLDQIMSIINQWGVQNGVPWADTVIPPPDSDGNAGLQIGLFTMLQDPTHGGVWNGDYNYFQAFNPLFCYLTNQGIYPLGINAGWLGNVGQAVQVQGMNPQQILEYTTGATGGFYKDPNSELVFWVNMTGAPINLCSMANYGYAVPGVAFTIPVHNDSFFHAIASTVAGFFMDTGGAGLLVFSPFFAAGGNALLDLVTDVPVLPDIPEIPDFPDVPDLPPDIPSSNLPQLPPPATPPSLPPATPPSFDPVNGDPIPSTPDLPSSPPTVPSPTIPPPPADLINPTLLKLIPAAAGALATLNTLIGSKNIPTTPAQLLAQQQAQQQAVQAQYGSSTIFGNVGAMLPLLAVGAALLLFSK